MSLRIRTFTVTVILLLLFLLPSIPRVSATDLRRGESITFTSGCSNKFKSTTLYSVVAKLSDPWVTPQQQSLGNLAPGQQAVATWKLTVPPNAPLGPHSMTYQCFYTNPDGSAAPPQEPVTVQFNVIEANPPPQTQTQTLQTLTPSVTFPLHSQTQTQPYTYQEIGWDVLSGMYSDYCIIATAAYGSPMAPEVVYMRTVRDGMIGSTPTGRILRDAFSIWYYSWSPPIASWIASSDVLRAVFRLLLIPIVFIVQVTAYVFKALGGGDLGAVVGFTIAALLSIGTYIMVPMLLGWIVTRLHKRIFAVKRWRSRDV